jgi:hypothetical protein
MSITHVARCGKDGTDMKRRMSTVFTIDMPTWIVPCPRVTQKGRCPGGFAPRWDVCSEINHLYSALCPSCGHEFFFKLSCMQPTLETFITPHGAA